MSEDVRKDELLKNLNKRIEVIEAQLSSKEGLAFGYSFRKDLPIAYYNRWIKDSNFLFNLLVNLKRRRKNILSQI